jgi:hypothetical protein
MNRSIPGTETVEGREFIYIEASAGEGFSELVDQAMNSRPEIPMPESGGVIEMKAFLMIDGVSLFGLSYKGDLDGWRRKFSTYCEDVGKQFGIATEGTLVLSDGRQLALADCDVTFQS